MNDQKKHLDSCFPHLQGIDGRGQMGSALPRHARALAHDWGQMLMFEGKTCSLFRSFTMVEGAVNRLKLIKRSMYGRAKFDLLRIRVLYAT